MRYWNQGDPLYDFEIETSPQDIQKKIEIMGSGTQKWYWDLIGSQTRTNLLLFRYS